MKHQDLSKQNRDSEAEAASSADKPVASDEVAAAPLMTDMFTRADGGDTYYFFEGPVDNFVFGERARRLFWLRGFNVRRRFNYEGETFMLSREIAFYFNPATRELLEDWQNPLNDETCKVVPVLNDPVNFALADAPAFDFGEHWGLRMEIYPTYPLPGRKRNYSSGEHFIFTLSKADIAAGHPERVICSWSRTGPYLKWMQMDEDSQGFLQYHAVSRRFERLEDLPADLVKLVEESHPLFLHAPDSYDPNVRNGSSFSR